MSQLDLQNKHKKEPTEVVVRRSPYADMQRRQKKVERAVLLGTLAFVVALFVVAWNSDTQVGRYTRGFVKVWTNGESQGSGNVVEQCAAEANKNTPYCQERRARAESTWKGIERGVNNNGTIFTLHGH